MPQRLVAFLHEQEEVMIIDRFATVLSAGSLGAWWVLIVAALLVGGAAVAVASYFVTGLIEIGRASCRERV